MALCEVETGDRGPVRRSRPSEGGDVGRQAACGDCSTHHCMYAVMGLG